MKYLFAALTTACLVIAFGLWYSHESDVAVATAMQAKEEVSPADSAQVPDRMLNTYKVTIIREVSKEVAGMNRAMKEIPNIVATDDAVAIKTWARLLINDRDALLEKITTAITHIEKLEGPEAAMEFSQRILAVTQLFDSTNMPMLTKKIKEIKQTEETQKSKEEGATTQED